MSTLYVMFDVQVYCECMYKSIDGLMVSNSVEVELQGVCNSVYCVHNVFNSTCTVRGPNTCIYYEYEQAHTRFRYYIRSSVNFSILRSRVNARKGSTVY